MLGSCTFLFIVEARDNINVTHNRDYFQAAFIVSADEYIVIPPKENRLVDRAVRSKILC